jgi:hypothetical protein
MAREHRSAAEMLPAGRLVGEEKKLVLATWLDRLKNLPIPPEKPLEARLTMGDDGMLILDLSGTPWLTSACSKGCRWASYPWQIATTFRTFAHSQACRSRTWLCKEPRFPIYELLGKMHTLHRFGSRRD